MNLLCWLGITEGHCGHIFEDGHFHSAVTSIQEGHQWTWMHWPVQDGRSDTWVAQEENTRATITRVQRPLMTWHSWISNIIDKDNNSLNTFLLFLYCTCSDLIPQPSDSIVSIYMSGLPSMVYSITTSQPPHPQHNHRHVWLAITDSCLTNPKNKSDFHGPSLASYMNYSSDFWKCATSEVACFVLKRRYMNV